MRLSISSKNNHIEYTTKIRGKPQLYCHETTSALTPPILALEFYRGDSYAACSHCSAA